LAQKHRISDDVFNAMIDEGLTVDQAATRILGEVEARGTAAPTLRVGSDRAADQPFASAGEQLVAVIQRTKFGKRDARLDSNASPCRATAPMRPTWSRGRRPA
jgi:hypothetical protein